MNLYTIALAALALAATGTAGAGCEARSPAHRVALVELYTSEGCSSCPPADDYLAGLKPGSSVVPLALHVDYWNYIGWKDPFSRPAFSARQRWLSDLAHSRTIYTPELFIAGSELRGGPGSGWLGRNWSSTLPPTVEKINAQPAGASIRIALGMAGSSGLPLEVEASAAGAARLYIALTQDGVASQVNAGENRGRLLRHEHVVREWLEPVAFNGGKARVARAVPLPAGAPSGTLGVAAFVQSEQGEVLQALALPLCKG